MSDTNNSDAQLNAGTVPAQSALQDAIAPSKSISGHANDQNTLSFCRGSEVQADRAPVAQPVDRKTIEGSTPGDFRKGGDTAKASVEQASTGHGDFDTMGGQKMGQFPLRGN
jgi:hypothetical protein